MKSQLGFSSEDGSEKPHFGDDDRFGDARHSPFRLRGLKLEMVGFQPGWFQQDGFFHGLFLRG